ncbi:DNA topoisomerase-1 [Novosphingobium chloroacetimidivorans]|uniref:DNA topoisomerase n=1 Tax=Novosphingobium chloroacetimidivorans TaxID=1428314 RepID=A0A7W7KBX1_9SPHN|nr:DNA topoisomerase IB [Novosphingobium chloroacetimidivorans]MBB4859982.1 DNA topoisomerase-1 [Novosphingobium chloroacetimidivorans]
MPQLRFVDHTEPGITRRKVRGDKWGYFTPEGKRITDREEIDRLNRIALPPAYENCWYCPDPDAHLLAIGYDARGRRQYRYHPNWREERDAAKFDLCSQFARKLPAIRKRVAEDIASRKLTRERAIATIVALLDTGAIRVGNEQYAKENKSFGATTLRNRHARIDRGMLRLRFRGKSGKMHEIDCDDKKLVRCVRIMQDLPGQHLFQYLDDDGAPTPVHSHDVNEYIQETMGDAFTAKHFRTWAASSFAFGRLVEEPGISLKNLMTDVSERLGNTPTIARKSYVHPAVVAAAKGGEGAPTIPDKLPRTTQWLTSEERGLIDFLEELKA